MENAINCSLGIHDECVLKKVREYRGSSFIEKNINEVDINEVVFVRYEVR